MNKKLGVKPIRVCRGSGGGPLQEKEQTISELLSLSRAHSAPASHLQFSIANATPKKRGKRIYHVCFFMVVFFSFRNVAMATAMTITDSAETEARAYEGGSTRNF